jgi:predicted nucleic acid-binding protein
MSGIEYLLDTNFILGMLKSTPTVTEVLNTRPLLASQCAYSAVTRMELLGFSGITLEEESLIRSVLEKFTYLPIDSAVEDMAIQLRRSRRVKLPDALIAATVLCHGLQLLSMDLGLQSVIRDNRPTA